MTQYFTCEVHDHEIAEIMAMEPGYWIGLLLIELPKKTSLTAKQVFAIYESMQGLERDEFMRLVTTSETTTLVRKP